jgi:crotonobetainyl-CoA:carnitine CoA-transferase CaiB-like acyl-CoA transferase
VAQAVSGLTFLSGLPDLPPAGWGWSYMDDTGGMYGAICALTGLYHRNITGKGQHIDLSQMVASVPLVGPALLDFTVNGRGSRRRGYPPGNRAHWPGTPLLNNYRGPMVAPHNAYRTDPGGYNDWCVIVCQSDEEWARLVQVMEAPPWAATNRFATVAGRLQHQEELDEHIEAWTRTLGKYEVTERCQASGVRACRCKAPRTASSTTLSSAIVECIWRSSTRRSGDTRCRMLRSSCRKRRQPIPVPAQ